MPSIAGHADIGHDQVETPLRRLDLGVSVLAVLGNRDDVPGIFERARGERADGFVVLDDQDVCHAAIIAGKNLTFPESHHPSKSRLSALAKSCALPLKTSRSMPETLEPSGKFSLPSLNFQMKPGIA